MCFVANLKNKFFSKKKYLFEWSLSRDQSYGGGVFCFPHGVYRSKFYIGSKYHMESTSLAFDRKTKEPCGELEFNPSELLFLGRLKSFFSGKGHGYSQSIEKQIKIPIYMKGGMGRDFMNFISIITENKKL